MKTKHILAALLQAIALLLIFGPLIAGTAFLLFSDRHELFAAGLVVAMLLFPVAMVCDDIADSLLQ